MRRWIRLAWIACTNAFFVIPFIDYYFFSLWHYVHWYTIFEARKFWTLLAAAAVLGFALDAVNVRSARIVNIGLWCLFAVKIAAAAFSLWGRFTEDPWMAFFVVPFALLVAGIDLLLYRPKLTVAA